MSEKRVVACVVRDGVAHLFTEGHEDEARAMVANDHWPLIHKVTGATIDGEPLEPIATKTHRLHWNFEVSDKSPTVMGTRITVDDVVSLIVDGWTWGDILRYHPELTEADIRACQMFAVEGEGIEPVEAARVEPREYAHRRAIRTTSDHSKPGTVLASVITTRGKMRHVFEYDDPAGNIHISNPTQIKFLDDTGTEPEGE